MRQAGSMNTTERVLSAIWVPTCCAEATASRQREIKDAVGNMAIICMSEKRHMKTTSCTVELGRVIPVGDE